MFWTLLKGIELSPGKLSIFFIPADRSQVIWINKFSKMAANTHPLAYPELTFTLTTDFPPYHMKKIVTVVSADWNTITQLLK